MMRSELYKKVDAVSTYSGGDRSGFSVKSDIMKIIEEYCLRGESDEVVRLMGENAGLEAKVFAYEQIIGKSNFAPFLPDRVLTTKLGCQYCTGQFALLSGEDWSVFIHGNKLVCSIGGDESDYKDISVCPVCGERLFPLC